jgi:hypothetical protein
VDDEDTRTTVALVAGIPPGRVLTCGRVAAEVAERLAPRAGPRAASVPFAADGERVSVEEALGEPRA